MTSQTRTLIGAEDIAGIEIECQKCGLTVFYPAGGERVAHILAGCPNCCDGFFDEGNKGQEFPAINELQKIVSALRALVRPDRTDIHANIRFRITDNKE
jgi:hypothetical protein